VLIAVPLVNWLGTSPCVLSDSSSDLLLAATLYTFIKNPTWLDAPGSPAGLLAQIISESKNKKVKMFSAQ